MGAGVPRLRTLVLTTSYPTRDDSVRGTFVREYVRAALPHCDVVVAHLDRVEGVRGLHLSERDDDGVPVHRIRYPRLPKALSYLWHLRAARAGLRAAGDVDLVHAHFFLAALPAVLFARKPLVVSEHWTVFMPEDPMELSRTHRFAAKLAFERAGLVLAVSEPLERAIRQCAPRARTRVLPNAVDEDVFHPGRAPRSDGPKRILTVGLLGEQKGIDVLLEAVGTLRAGRGDVQVDVVGNGERRREYEELAARLGLAAVVTFHGLRSKAEIADLMRGSDLFVLPSRFENNPVVLLEALSCGLPVVATDVGGVAEIVGDAGLLARPGDPESLAEQTAQALEQLETFDRAKIAGRARERYGSERIGRELAELYRDLMGLH